MSTFALEETLEADWVAVRPHAFHEREKHKFAFIVAWNEIEGKFAITCHNRTAQRQRSGSREQQRRGDGGHSSSSGGGGGSSGPAGAERRPASAKGPGTSPAVRRSPLWSAGEAGAAPCKGSPAAAAGLPRAESLPRSSGGRAAEASPMRSSPGRARSAQARRPLPPPPPPPPPPSPSKALLSPAACAADEIEVLDLGKEEEEEDPDPAGVPPEAPVALPSPPAGPGGAAAPPSAGSSSSSSSSSSETDPPFPPSEECSWAGLFSFQDLRAVHQQLCSVNSELEPTLPVLPEEPSGMWTVLFGAPELSEEEMDALCYRLQVYLGHCLDSCGWKILSQVLFTETDDPEEYYESLSELRQKGYEEVLQRARKRIQEVWRMWPETPIHPHPTWVLIRD